jgi:hypothetical protein
VFANVEMIIAFPGLREMYLNLREANAALRDAIVRGETIQAKDVINLSRDVSGPSTQAVFHHG